MYRKLVYGMDAERTDKKGDLDYVHINTIHDGDSAGRVLR